MKKLFFAVAAACGCAFFACAEQVQNWFSGGVESSAPTAVNGVWTSPSEGVTTNAASFTLDLTHDESLDFTPTAGTAPDTNVLTRLVSVVRFEPYSGTLPSLDAKAALMVSGAAYYAYANGAWTKLVNENVSVSEDLVTVLTEIDYKTSSSPLVRFGIISGNVTNYLHVVDAEAGSWLALGSTPTPALVSKVSFSGAGDLVSVRGDVQLGVASYNSVKYPTVQEAVNAAGTTENAKVTVLRDNNETITIASNQKIELDTNGKSSGAIVNNSDTPVEVDVKVPAATVEQGSGTYVVDASITGKANLTVTTSDTSKEAVGEIIESGTKIRVKVQTAASVMNDVKFDGKTVAAADTAAYRTFLEKYCGASDGAYMKANTTANKITTQLGANGGNGLPLWESYVLDLDPTKPTSKPAAVVKPATQSTSGMVLTIPTYKATLPASNYTVKYVLEKSEDSGTTWTSDKEYTDATTITVPFNSNQYRVNTVIQ